MIAFGPILSRRLGQSPGIKTAVITNSSLLWCEDVERKMIEIKYTGKNFYLRKFSKRQEP